MASFFGRIAEFFTTGSNVLSRRVRAFTSRIRRVWRQPTNDWSRPDYDFWRKAYRCQVRGLEISGLFIKPLINKLAAWSLGRPPQFKLDNETALTSLADWWNEAHPEILRAWRSALKQGDCFIVVNSDLTLTLLNPDTVDPIVAPDDYGRVIGWRVTQTLAHPELPAERMTIIDEYMIDERVHTMEINGVVNQQTVYPNLIGRLPIVHVVNAQEDGQTFGHPEAEALVEVLHRYGEIFEAAIEGNIRQGRPTPVAIFETAADMDRFWSLYGETETQNLPDGTTEQSTSLLVDLDQILTLSGNTKFSYEAPGSFTPDTAKILELAFYLILEHTEIPEFVFGNAIASSMASAETQLPVFVKFIEMRQGDMRGWLLDIAEVVLAYKAILEPGVTAERPILQYEALTDSDGNLTLSTITWAYAEGLLDDRTALMLAPIDVEDIDAVLAQAKKEREERQKEAMENNPLANDPDAIWRDEVNRTEALEDE